MERGMEKEELRMPKGKPEERRFEPTYPARETATGGFSRTSRIMARLSRELTSGGRNRIFSGLFFTIFLIIAL